MQSEKYRQFAFARSYGACLNFRAINRPANTASAEHLRHPIYTDAAGYWKNYSLNFADIVETPEPVLK